MGASNESNDSGFSTVMGAEQPESVHEPALRRTTQRPPDWRAPSSVSSIALERLGASQPIARRTGRRAEAASLRAQLAQARKRGDTDTERLLAAKLARLLVGRGSSFEEATKLARRSLLMGEDPKLREELSAWFASLGELSLAAGTLEALIELASPTARTQLRVAVLRARDGDARAAIRALKTAFESDPHDPLPLELLAGLRFWAPDLVPPARAAQALAESAKRRKARGDERGHVEALLRAVEADPASGPAADRLARYLSGTGRFQAADEIWRSCRVSGEIAVEVHELRLREALGAHDVPLALAATLDARADTRLDLDSLVTAASIVQSGAGELPVPNFDGLLAPLGLGTLLGARLLWASEQHGGETRARCLLSAARCWLPYGAEEAAELIGEALVEAPGVSTVFQALLDVVERTGDDTWLLEALVRVGRGPQDADTRKRLLQLGEMAETRFASANLGAWALGRASESAALSAEERQRQEAFLGRAESNSVWLRQADWGALSVAELRRASQILRVRPELSGQHAEALMELLRREPRDVDAFSQLSRLLGRLGRFDELERLWNDGLAAGVHSHQCLLGLMRLYHRQGAPEKIFELLDKPVATLDVRAVALLGAYASLFGDAEQRAAGLARLAQTARPEVAAVLYCQASDAALARGERHVAYGHAQRACQANARSVRSMVTFAEVADEAEPRVAILALERAMELVVPRRKYCRSLVSVALANDEPEVALRWARRWVSLAPLELESNRVLLTLLAQHGSAIELAKGLDWFVGQPRPRGVLAEELARALARLAEIDPTQGRQLAQRVLGAFGVVVAPLVAVLDQIAAQLDDPALRIAVIERLLVTDADCNHGELLCEAAVLHGRRGDGDAAFDALARALDAQAEPGRVASIAETLPAPATTDGELRQLYCRAQCAVQSEAGASAAIAALRELGATYWDLAGDRANATVAWQRAAQLDSVMGDETLSRDLIAFAGYADAIGMLRALAAERESTQGAHLLLSAAAVALHDGFNTHAIELASAALECDPNVTEALAVLERAVAHDQPQILQAAYERVAAAQLGVFGDRALNYRAARQFERRQQHELALDYAVKAFEAVPAEGVAYALMLRLASSVGDDARATRAIRGVAESTTNPRARSHWLEIAARSAGPGVEGVELRAEVLLRAVSVRTEPEAVLRAGEAIAALLRLAPEARERWTADFDTAARALLRSLAGAEDVPAALAVARTSFEVFDAPAQCAAALDRALQLDSAAAGFAGCERFAPLLEQQASAAKRVVDVTVACLDAEREVALPALSLALALAMGHASDAAPRLAVTRALVEPPNPEWIAQARQLAADQPDLLQQLDSATPREIRVEQLFAEFERLQSASPEAAIELAEAHLQVPWLHPPERVRLQRELLKVIRRLPDSQRLESALAARMQDETWSEKERREFATELVRLLAARQAHAAALDVIRVIEGWGELNKRELELAVDIARASGDAERELQYLEPQRALANSPEGRRVLWRRLWQLHEQLGRQDAALQDAERLLELDPGDESAHTFLLDDAERRADHRRIAHLLEERLKLRSGSATDYLSLAEVYSVRLTQPERAAEVLERAVEACGEVPLLLERLGQAYALLDRQPLAAITLERAVHASVDAGERARLAELAGRSFLRSGDPTAALRLVETPELPATEGLASLRVEVLRASGPSLRLARALAELAESSTGKPDQRGQWYCEAAELAIGLDDTEQGLEWARHAARVAPRLPAAQLLARRIEYLERGAGSGSEALSTITELRGLGDLRDADQAAMRSFLLAEALDQRVGLGAGQRELEATVRRFGDHPLTSLGLAERHHAAKRYSQAVELYESVVAAERPPVRDRERLLHDAIVCAYRAGRRDLSDAWSAIARAEGFEPPAEPSSEPPSSAEATQLGSPPPKPRSSNPTSGRTIQSAEFAAPEVPEVLLRSDPPGLTRTWVSNEDVDAPDLATSASSQTLAAPRSILPRPAVSSLARASFPASRRDSRPPVLVTGRPRIATDPGLGGLAPQPVVRISPATQPHREAAESFSETPQQLFDEPGVAGSQPAAQAPQPALPASVDERTEQELFELLMEGSVDAGERLTVLLARDDHRRHELIGVCRHLVSLEPGRLQWLERLRAAVVADHDVVFANALGHAVAVAAGAGHVPFPPPLAHQSIQADALLRLLRGATDPCLEVLGLLWQSAPHLFRKASAVPDSGVLVGSDALTPLAQLSGAACRLLGTGRISVYHRQGPRPVTFETNLDLPMRVVVRGPDLAESTEFRFHFGSILMATHAEYALLMSMDEGRLREIIDAVLAAFGPPARISGSPASVAIFAERLWESVPLRVQRRLQELATHPDQVDYDKAMSAAVRVLRRAGLFVSGDLAVAVRHVCEQEGLNASLLRDSDGLAELCAGSAALADLVRFATSAEFAEARWRSGRRSSAFVRGVG